MIREELAQPAAGLAAPDTDYRRPIRLGAWILAAGLGGFLLWAGLAPLDEGVPAPGVISVESKRKRIDHLTGGIVSKILARDGQRVREGEELLVFDEAQAKAALGAVQTQWRAAVAVEARLVAERDGLKAIAYPRVLLEESADPEVSAVLRGQSELFRSRRAALDGELAIVRESVLGLEGQVRSLEQLLRGREKQLQLFQEQLASYRKLNEQGFVSRNQLLEVERQLAEVQTKQGEDLANLAAASARLAEFRMRGTQRMVEYRREVEQQLAESQKDASTLSERLAAHRDVHTRLVVRAPVTGIVVGLAFHTVGGVIKPGERILDIVPEGDELIVEAQVAPQYIDSVRTGMAADVHFDAYAARTERPVVTGKVITVSADALTDARTAAQYYAVRVGVPDSELKKLGELRLQPGMPGTVIVRTGERSLLAYLARPFLRRFTTAMSER